MIVLGIKVPAQLRERWQRWLAPELQPFFIASLRDWPVNAGRHGLSQELADTYAVWRVDPSLKTLWMTKDTFFSMSKQKRSELLRVQATHKRGAVPSLRRWSDLLDEKVLRSYGDGYRFVWWPSLVALRPGDILRRVITAAPGGAEPSALPSRHSEVSKGTWSRCSELLPGARNLAGSFPSSSGPNCFASVMYAAGIPRARSRCVVEAPFLAWLTSACRPGGQDGEAGTVVVWRDDRGRPSHAAITIGDGWALEKGSSEWWTPYAIRPLDDVIRTRRTKGYRLERYRLVQRVLSRPASASSRAEAARPGSVRP